MNIFRMKPLVFSIPVLLSCIVAQTSQAGDNAAAVKSLDSITSQSSEIPSLLMETPVALPDAEVIAAPKPKAAPMRKSAGYRLQTSQAQTDAMNAQLAALKAEQEKKIAELAKQYAATQDSSAKALAAQQQKVADSEKQLNELQTKWQAATEQLESANKQIAELTATRLDEGSETVQLKQSLTDSQNQAATLTKKVAILTAVQQKLTDSEKQLADVQTKWQTAAQQLESANKQIADLTATRLDEGEETAQIKQSLTESQNETAALTKKMAALTADQTAKANELATVKKALAESDGKTAELQTKWQETTAKLDAQTKQMAAQKGTPATPAPVSKEDIRAYALGAFWGHDVLNAMKKVESDGFKVSQPQVVSGVTDMMSGKFKIPKEKMLAELQEMDASVTAKAQQPAPTNAANNDFIAKYSKKPGVKKSEMGYYYRITEKGRGAIKNSDVVAIAVTESLSNGKVIKDMNKTGKVLALPLDRFPPLFKTAISMMNNQGKLQMVVPPELAYGEAGSPPNIPPNATMVYDVKVVSISPAK